MQLQARAAETRQQQIRLSGVVEADGLAIGSYHVGKNTHHIQIFGMIQRNHDEASARTMVLEFMPIAVVPKGSVPPVVSKDRIDDTKVLGNMDRKKKVVLITDDAPCFLQICQQHHWEHQFVSHRNQQFNRAVTRGRSQLQVGTALIDAAWRHLKKSLPPTLKMSTKGKPNPRLRLYIFSWLWRWSLPVASDPFVELGRFCVAERDCNVE